MTRLAKAVAGAALVAAFVVGAASISQRGVEAADHLDSTRAAGFKAAALKANPHVPL
jgi:hypothetical protein